MDVSKVGPFFVLDDIRRTMMTYDRPATTINDQIEILQRRGLIVSNTCRAEEILSSIGYFRFKGYCLAFYGPQYEKFLPGTTIEKINRVYLFDVAVRMLLLSASQQVEVNVKAKMGSIVPLQNGPVLTNEAFLIDKNWQDWIQRIGRARMQGGSRRELFIRHYSEKYGEFPLWVDLELTTLGNLSRLFSWLSLELKKSVASPFGVPYEYLGNWLHCITVVRNICAHNARLVGRELPIRVRIPKAKQNLYEPTQLFSVWYAFRKLLPTVEYAKYVRGLIEIVEEYQAASVITEFGFPKNWRELLLSEF